MIPSDREKSKIPEADIVVGILSNISLQKATLKGSWQRCVLPLTRPQLLYLEKMLNGRLDRYIKESGNE